MQLALKFLKDNNITAQLEASAPMANMVNSLPSAAELEKTDDHDTRLTAMLCFVDLELDEPISSSRNSLISA